jgi:hypothetical protein
MNLNERVMGVLALKVSETIQSAVSNMKTGHTCIILSEFSDQTWSFIRHGKNRELINLTGLYPKVSK